MRKTIKDQRKNIISVQLQGLLTGITFLLDRLDERETLYIIHFIKISQKSFLYSKWIKWNTIICETRTKMEIFKSNGSFCNFYPNLPKTFFTHKMSKNKVHTWNTVHRKIMVKKNWCMKRELYQLFWNSRISIIKKILEEFNNFFEKTAEKIDKKTPKSNKHFSNYLKNQNLNSILLDSVTRDEIESLICNLGPNSIPTRILK